MQIVGPHLEPTEVGPASWGMKAPPGHSDGDKCAHSNKVAGLGELLLQLGQELGLA